MFFFIVCNVTSDVAFQTHLFTRMLLPSLRVVYFHGSNSCSPDKQKLKWWNCIYHKMDVDNKLAENEFFGYVCTDSQLTCKQQQTIL